MDTSALPVVCGVWTGENPYLFGNYAEVVRRLGPGQEVSFIVASEEEKQEFVSAVGRLCHRIYVDYDATLFAYRILCLT